MSFRSLKMCFGPKRLVNCELELKQGKSIILEVDIELNIGMGSPFDPFTI